MSGASAVVVFEADMKISPFMPSKFADYASLKKPILAVTPQTSLIRDYIEKYNAGITVNHDRNEIVNGLINIFSNQINENEIQTFSSKKLFKEFSFENVGRLYKDMIIKIMKDN